MLLDVAQMLPNATHLLLMLLDVAQLLPKVTQLLLSVARCFSNVAKSYAIVAKCC